MKSFQILLPAAAALALASCASNKSEYDTNNPYGPSDATTAAYQPAASGSQTYDTPAVYEDAGNAASTPSVNLPATAKPSKTLKPTAHPATRPTTAHAPAAVASAGPATTHVVVKGDTLSGISKKYKVPVASIKAANGMTKDIVVLGAKLKIPAH